MKLFRTLRHACGWLVLSSPIIWGVACVVNDAGVLFGLALLGGVVVSIAVAIALAMLGVWLLEEL